MTSTASATQSPLPTCVWFHKCTTRGAFLWTWWPFLAYARWWNGWRRCLLLPRHIHKPCPTARNRQSNRKESRCNCKPFTQSLRFLHAYITRCTPYKKISLFACTRHTTHTLQEGLFIVVVIIVLVDCTTRQCRHTYSLTAILPKPLLFVISRAFSCALNHEF